MFTRVYRAHVCVCAPCFDRQSNDTRQKKAANTRKCISERADGRVFYWRKSPKFASATRACKLAILGKEAPRAVEEPRSEFSPPTGVFERTMHHVGRTGRRASESRRISRIRAERDGFTVAWQRGQAPSQTKQPAATGGAYHGSDNPLRSEPLSQRRAPPLAPSDRLYRVSLYRLSAGDEAARPFVAFRNSHAIS